jgi:molybdopterin-guanine dinucleotide biosynthesis protein A
MPTLAAIVPAGGRARRLAGHKLGADVVGRSLLDRTIDGLPADAYLICVGVALPTDRSVSWVRENPPFGGPLAAVAAGAAALGPDVDRVLVVGGDMPEAGRAVQALLAALRSRTDCAVVRDNEGRRQALLSAWSRSALAQRLEALAPVEHRPLGALLDDLVVAEVPDRWGAAADVDTPDDLAVARGRFEPPLPRQR